jgi:hypothetical protein
LSNDPVDLIQKFIDGGAVVKSGDDLPDDIRAEIDARAADMPADRVTVELTSLDDDQVYYYQDSYLRLTIPIPRIDVFDAYLKELAELGTDTDLRDYIKILARAFWWLHQRPHKLKGPKDKQAVKLLVEAIPRADVAVNSLRDALLGLTAYVFGKKKEVKAPDSAESPNP